MGIFLNSRIPFDSYQATSSGKYYVDKTSLIAELIPALGTDERFFCITRPRRFGKTVMANMVGAFFGKSMDSDKIFRCLKIASPEITDQLEGRNYRDYMNQYDVIYIDFSEVPEQCSSYSEYITRILWGLKKDFLEEFPDICKDYSQSIWDMITTVYQKTGRRFIFVIDEWDAVFHMSFITDADREAYLLLKSLLKDKFYVELAYMTGILPIARYHASHGTQESMDSFVGASGESLRAAFPADTPYSDGSELNMFQEYHMATRGRFGNYFGFLDSEVDLIFSVYQKTTPTPFISREDLRTWYDGYYTKAGDKIYNPRSVVCALSNNELANYWTSSGTYDSIFSYIKDNTAGIRDDIPLLFADGTIPCHIQEYAATSMGLETKDEIYSAMVVYGLLTYKDGAVSIPNKELMDSFAAMMRKEKNLGYIYRLANISNKMLSATLSGNSQRIAEILKYVHDTEVPILSYNREIELAAVVNLVYLAARDTYRVEREDKAGEGFVDFIFYPEQRDADAIILELKIDGSPDDAIRQIKNKKYALRFQGKIAEKPKYTGRILAVGISYDRKTKEHLCKIEQL